MVCVQNDSFINDYESKRLEITSYKKLNEICNFVHLEKKGSSEYMEMLRPLACIDR